jgi:hypothetical protein
MKWTCSSGQLEIQALRSINDIKRRANVEFKTVNVAAMKNELFSDR